MASVPDRDVVEAFAQTVAADFLDCIVVSVLPWSIHKQPPSNILVPSDPGTLLDEDDIAKAIATRHIVLVPCTFETPEEEHAASKILPQFMSFEHVCVFMIQLMPPGVVPSRETNDILMKRHDAMLAIGVDDVIIDPQRAALEGLIALARASWELNLKRMQMMLESEPETVTPEAMTELEAQHGHLLWESIPRALMPHFRPLDKSVVETSVNLAAYQLIKRFEANHGTVIQAVDQQNILCAIKVIDKSSIQSPGELEGIYREYRFLSGLLDHENIVRCLDMVHSTSRVYLVLDYAGPNNLAQVLSSRPGQRFDEEDMLHCFEQIVRAIAHCHSRDVNHRTLSLEHVVLSRNFHCTLIDFHCAMVAKGDTVSQMVCGNLPCIAPEMALGGPYIPRLADCWSVGVVLLEAGGGLSSLQRSVSFDIDAEPQQVVRLIQQFFSKPGSHEHALAYSGGVRHPTILSMLEQLLKPIPAQRIEMHDLQMTWFGE